MTIETTSPAGQLAPVPTHTEAVSAAVHAWVSGLDIASRGAEFVVDTPACPDSFWPLPPNVKPWEIPGKNPKLRLPNESEESFRARRTVAVQTVGFVVRYGLGLGLSPEVSLNGIFVIGGRPSMYAEQMVALIKSHGHKHKTIEKSATQCTVQVKHRDEPDWEEFTYSIEDAITAGYVKGKGPNKDGKGGNDKYNLDPKAMLYARVSSIACKTKFPEILRGMVTYEELQDERAQGDEHVVTITNVTAQDIKARTTAVTPAAEPKVQDAEPAQPQAAEVESPDELIPAAQIRRVQTSFKDMGVENIGLRRDAISALIGREIDALKMVTKAESGPLIERLDEISRGANPMGVLAALITDADQAAELAREAEAESDR